MRRVLLCTFIAFIHQFCIDAQTVQPFENSLVHEAFVTRENGNLLLDAINAPPPESVNERIPRQRDMQSIWIPGYWKWDSQKNDFIWVCGVWRRPPPGHQWISGFWKQYDKEWAWVSGYWSRTSEQHTHYIQLPPPNQLDENIAPAASSNYFWVPGHWYFKFDCNEYEWVPGQWEELDSQWVLMPSRYVWRPGGYVYVPAYWDWALEERGTVFSCVLIESQYRRGITYEPASILQPEAVIRQVFPYYPDYLSLVHHHYHYHSDFWRSFCCLPPWWSWDTWWGLSWHDQWSLWWWYSHPGYPQPAWMTKEISSIIPPPVTDLLAIFSHVSAPRFITPRGVATRTDFLHALNRVAASYLPIVPDNNKVLDRIQQLAKPVSIDNTQILKPLGRRLPIDPNAVRPNVRKPVVNFIGLSGIKMIREDSAPRIPFKPRIPTNRSSAMWRPQEERQLAPPIQERRPTWTPSSAKSCRPLASQYLEQSDREEALPSSCRSSTCRGQPPIQRPPVYNQRNNRQRSEGAHPTKMDRNHYDSRREAERSRG